MSQSSLWAFRIRSTSVLRLGELRGMPGVQAALWDDVVWVRGSGLDDELFGILAAFADGPVFFVDANNRLTPYNKSVPIDRLPDVTWQPISQSLEPVLPVARVVSVQFPKCQLTLERSSVEREASVMIADWDAFEHWAINAPEVRLKACQFATQGSGNESHVCLRGNPLPPLLGPRFWTIGNIAIPLGFTWAPAVDADTLREVLGRVLAADAGQLPEESKSGSLAARDNITTMARLWIWHQDNRFDVIEQSSFVPALRMHVRATGELLKSELAAGESS